MALVPNFNICEADDLKSLSFYDVTGVYNATTNPTGYGTPNPSPSDVTTATISILLPGGTTPVVLTVKGGSLTTSLPTTDNTLVFTITNVLLGLTADALLPDGVYDITYTLTGTYSSTSFTATGNCKRFLTGQVELCLDSKLNKLEAPSDCESCDQCGDPESDLMKLNCVLVFLTVAIYAASVYKLNKATKILEYVQDYCAKTPCTNC